MLEAMKMEMQVVAPFSGKVRKVMTMPNVQVDTGAPAPPNRGTGGDADDRSRGTRASFGAKLEATHGLRYKPLAVDSLKELRQLMLGFDIDPKQRHRYLARLGPDLPCAQRRNTQHEDEILSIFVDICSLFHREPEVNHRAAGEEPSAEDVSILLSPHGRDQR